MQGGKLLRKINDELIIGQVGRIHSILRNTVLLDVFHCGQYVKGKKEHVAFRHICLKRLKSRFKRFHFIADSGGLETCDQGGQDGSLPLGAGGIGSNAADPSICDGLPSIEQYFTTFCKARGRSGEFPK